MFDLSFQQLLMRAIAGVVILTAFGAAVACAARFLGDKGPAYDGRLTLNPFRQVDIFGLIAATITLAGWTRPIAIDAGREPFGRGGVILCALGGLVFVLVLGWLAPLMQMPVARYWPASSAPFMAALIATFATATRWFVVFNLIPVPPLAGGYVLAAAAPGAHGWLMARIGWVSFVLAIVVVLTHRYWFGAVLGGAVAGLRLG